MTCLPKANNTPHSSGSHVKWWTYPSMERACRSYTADIAPVGDFAFMFAAFRAILLQTSDWSERRNPLVRMDEVTSAVRDARALANMTWGAGLNVSSERMFQRPASTQDTGITIVFFGGARMVKFRVRFCLAPTNSSPSTSSTGRGPLFSN